MDASSGATPLAWGGKWTERSSGDAALSRGGGETEELVVFVSGRGGTRARTPLRRCAVPCVPESAGLESSSARRRLPWR
uniref:Uncharacterized protein n=1 Tax=Oryza meridionalis TaxID=40149 RepID=A0A0E0F4J3_9ORYZ